MKLGIVNYGKDRFEVLDSDAGRRVAIFDREPDAEGYLALVAHIRMLTSEVEALKARLEAAGGLATVGATLMELDAKRFLDARRVAVDDYIAICIFCGAEDRDENNLKHKSSCAIELFQAALCQWQEVNE